MCMGAYFISLEEKAHCLHSVMCPNFEDCPDITHSGCPRRGHGVASCYEGYKDDKNTISVFYEWLREDGEEEVQK